MSSTDDCAFVSIKKMTVEDFRRRLSSVEGKAVELHGIALGLNEINPAQSMQAEHAVSSMLYVLIDKAEELSRSLQELEASITSKA